MRYAYDWIFKLSFVEKSISLKFGHSEKATKFEKNLPLKIWRYSLASNFKWNFFSNSVAFSEYPNFNTSVFFANIKSVHIDQIFLSIMSYSADTA